MFSSICWHGFQLSAFNHQLSPFQAKGGGRRILQIQWLTKSLLLFSFSPFRLNLNSPMPSQSLNYSLTLNGTCLPATWIHYDIKYRRPPYGTYLSTFWKRPDLQTFLIWFGTATSWGYLVVAQGLANHPTNFLLATSMYAHIHLQPIPTQGLFCNFSLVAHVATIYKGTDLRWTKRFRFFDDPGKRIGYGAAYRSISFFSHLLFI